MKPVISLALPTWNSSPILWLALESLCRQETQYPWELIACEDPSENFCGKEYFNPYEQRLQKAGCVNFKFIELDQWIPLSYKWKILANYSSSENFMLVASDDYNDPYRIEITCRELKTHDWVDWDEGVFLNLNSGEKATWVRPFKEKTGIYMGTKTSFIKELPSPYPTKGVDGWIRSGANITNRKPISTLPNGICTDGANVISLHRKDLYKDLKIFKPFLGKLEDIIPLDVLDMLKNKFKI